MTLEELKALPKIELHCHLDGSLSREFLESRLGRKVEPSEIHSGISGEIRSSGTVSAGRGRTGAGRV